jgi:hypothetical protein
MKIHNIIPAILFEDENPKERYARIQAAIDSERKVKEPDSLVVHPHDARRQIRKYASQIAEYIGGNAERQKVILSFFSPNADMSALKQMAMSSKDYSTFLKLKFGLNKNEQRLLADNIEDIINDNFSKQADMDKAYDDDSEDIDDELYMTGLALAADTEREQIEQDLEISRRKKREWEEKEEKKRKADQLTRNEIRDIVKNLKPSYVDKFLSDLGIEMS